MDIEPNPRWSRFQSDGIPTEAWNPVPVLGALVVLALGTFLYYQNRNNKPNLTDRLMAVVPAGHGHIAWKDYFISDPSASDYPDGIQLADLPAPVCVTRTPDGKPVIAQKITVTQNGNPIAAGVQAFFKRHANPNDHQWSVAANKYAPHVLLEGSQWSVPVYFDRIQADDNDEAGTKATLPDISRLLNGEEVSPPDQLRTREALDLKIRLWREGDPENSVNQPAQQDSFFGG